MTEEDVQPILANEKKWIYTRDCWCDDCRFYSVEERSECPAKPGPTEPWRKPTRLFRINPKLIGCKDYEEPLAFSPPRAFTEVVIIREIREIENGENGERSSHSE